MISSEVGLGHEDVSNLENFPDQVRLHIFLYLMIPQELQALIALGEGQLIEFKPFGGGERSRDFLPLQRTSIGS